MSAIRLTEYSHRGKASASGTTAGQHTDNGALKNLGFTVKGQFLDGFGLRIIQITTLTRKKVQ